MQQCTNVVLETQKDAISAGCTKGCGDERNKLPDCVQTCTDQKVQETCSAQLYACNYYKHEAMTDVVAMKIYIELSDSDLIR